MKQLPRSLILTLAWSLFWPALATAQEAVRLDRIGDPLPPASISRMGSTRFHQGDNIQSLAWSPDGKFIASGNFGVTREIVLWDTATGRVHLKLVWPGDGPARSLAF